MSDFIGRFEAGTLTKEEWTHAAHLRVAAYYISNFSPLEAGVRIRTGIRHLNECLGGVNDKDSGYHETLTEFWIREVRAHLEAHGPDGVETLVQLPSGLWKRDYASDLPKNRKARREYLRPGEA